MELGKALVIAEQVLEVLSPHCSIINIAGSCRREKPEVKDIEIVALPKVVSGQDLFGGKTEPYRADGWKDAVAGLGEGLKGRYFGKYMQIALPQKVNLDLFAPDDFDYWRQMVIRTGSADWVTKYVAAGWKAIGWCGSDQGLRRISQCEGQKDPAGKMHWKCIVPEFQQMKPNWWKDEREFFAWLHLDYVEPKFREIV